jgi:hypothetical protein
MSVIEERNAEILRPQLKLIAQGWSRVLDVPPEVGNRDRVSIKTLIRDSVDDCEDTRSTLLSTRGGSNTLAAGPLDLDRRQFHAIAGK